MNVVLIRRYIWLINTLCLAGRRGMTFEEIDDKYRRRESISNGDRYEKRTFHRHRIAIYDIFGVEILCDRFTNTYYIEDECDLGDASVSRQWLLEAFTVDSRLLDAVDLKDRVLMEGVPSSFHQLSPVLAAMESGKKVEFEHSPYYRDSRMMVCRFEVYAVRSWRRRWYMVGRGVTEDMDENGMSSQDLMMFALDRVSNLTITDESYSLPADWSAKDFFAGCYGVVLDMDYDIEEVEIAATPLRAKYLRTMPLHQSQHEVRDGVFRYNLRPTNDFVRDIMGVDIKVLRPEWLKKEVAANLREALRQYEEE